MQVMAAFADAGRRCNADETRAKQAAEAAEAAGGKRRRFSLDLRGLKGGAEATSDATRADMRAALFAPRPTLTRAGSSGCSVVDASTAAAATGAATAAGHPGASAAAPAPAAGASDFSHKIEAALSHRRSVAAPARAAAVPAQSALIDALNRKLASSAVSLAAGAPLPPQPPKSLPVPPVPPQPPKSLPVPPVPPKSLPVPPVPPKSLPVPPVPPAPHGMVRRSSSKRLREAAQSEGRPEGRPLGGSPAQGQPTARGAPPASAEPAAGGMQDLLDALNRRVNMALEKEMKRGPFTPRGTAT